MNNPYTGHPVGSDESLKKSALNLIETIDKEWLPNINERRSNPQLRQADLFRCALALTLAPMAAQNTQDPELRDILERTSEAVKRYQAALEVDPAKAQA